MRRPYPTPRVGTHGDARTRIGGGRGDGRPSPHATRAGPRCVRAVLRGGARHPGPEARGPKSASRWRHDRCPSGASARDAGDDRFSEARIGLDHLSFRIETASELEKLAQRLRELGAEVGKPEHDPHGGGIGLAFRDPDNIQLEFYAGP
jgi:catechol 2,3-dioxygenase-like lactoylglutathione lyase family enzyme